MSEKIQTVRGTKDLYGEEQIRFNHVVNTAARISSLYGFEHLTTPIIEFSEVFDRSLGETSDVVNKEMYSFDDKGGESITLRPEFTASVCRAFISNGLDNQLPLKFFSYGPLFRYERPQKGRQRQFHQLNFEILGISSFRADVELIVLANHLLKELGIDSKVELHINSLGCHKSRLAYRTALVEYLSKYFKELSEDSKNRFEKNPMRILDSKDENDQKIIQSAPLIEQYYTDEAKLFYDNILASLSDKGIKYTKNPKIVRGLDYYTHTAFEFITHELGAQGTVLAGGRYDSLIKNLGGKDVPGVGFASGIERLMMLLDNTPSLTRSITVIPVAAQQYGYASSLVDVLRQNDFKIDFELDENIDSSKRIKKAVANHSKFVLFVGEDEVEKSSVTIRDLDTRKQEEIKNTDLIDYLNLNVRM